VIVVGVVESFDDRRGDGFIVRDTGERFYFHCVSILDGSREISVGQRVNAARHVGHVGRDEVIDVEKIDALQN
jgi:cold shock CspA family protein